ncbi:putative exonuclease RdgC [Geothermobacter ehrlichii]|uniref:Putative exonuclease RdgC n=1 Tax=Geothermobacter ehrlichii TaxID=213224 RepID=A0A5D3WL89_9BACT|nr:recombination-associated protein RdgC [Geothermobacter ehrlichii]TYO98894.1 putative exonuclease RdgC [Geothermobacter ehrlichii]
MGILANTVSLCQFRVVGEKPSGDLFDWAGERLAANRFQSIDRGSEELSVGWVQLDDPQQAGFERPNSYRRDHWLCFSLRRDQRKVPARLLKEHYERAEAEFLQNNPGLKRVPKQKKEELREAVKASLLARTLPTPAVYDAVWDTESGLVSFTSLGSKQIELFCDLFKQTFEGLRLVAFHPYARAGAVIPDQLRPALETANRAETDTVSDLMEKNAWLGEDFLLWLLDQTLHASGEFAVSRPGPAVEGEGFVAYLNDRLVISGASESGVQKLVLSGPQDRFSEACTALLAGKTLQEAVIYLEKGEDVWKLSLKAPAFHFAGLRAPGVQLEKDDLTDPDLEREALFFERMHLLQSGLQLFDSLLAHFLEQRLAPEWPESQKAIMQRLQQANEPASRQPH